jgi:hypothetical protein
VLPMNVMFDIKEIIMWFSPIWFSTQILVYCVSYVILFIFNAYGYILMIYRMH